jgi:thiosulfate/3-mercaptopyruvate sulfurtransferase
MIETYFGMGALDSAQAHLAALVVGFFFGVCLEQAGFGSSRRLAGIFYFRDMTVLKVMFSALITAMIGLLYFLGMGWISPEQLYFMPSVYGAQIVGGLIFGVGFVMSGWCPGTAAVGLASGKVDALLFLLGAAVGSVLFNELFSILKPLYQWGESGVRFAFDALGMSSSAFAFLFTCVAVVCFWGAEWIERKVSQGGAYLGSPFLKSFSAVLIIAAAGLLILPGVSPMSTASALGRVDSEKALLLSVETAADHMDAVDLADRLMAGDAGLVLVDLRTPAEYARFHLPGALNVSMSELPSVLGPSRDVGIIVLYSNGMTHPAQARDSLARMGFRNVTILTDGLEGFIETCLKPASLRSEPVSEEMAGRIAQWRHFFYAAGGNAATPAATAAPLPEADSGPKLPGVVETDWLASQLGRKDLRILDVRSQPEYNTGHIPGSVYLSVDSLRGVVRSIPSMLLPAPMLAMHFSQMGIRPGDLVVVVSGDKMQDATLVGMACERLNHRRYAVLNGGFGKWAAENRPMDAVLPEISESSYPAPGGPDAFTVDHLRVLQASRTGDAVILDVRPEEYFTGARSEEARAGHVPGAVNRPFTADVSKKDGIVLFKPTDELAAAYARVIPERETTVIVHCRTGHQASQTFFVLKHLLGYSKVLYYDAGWTEWAARPELPVATGPATPP